MFVAMVNQYGCYVLGHYPSCCLYLKKTPVFFPENTAFRKLGSVSVLRQNLLCWAQSIELIPISVRIYYFNIYLRLGNIIFLEDMPCSSIQVHLYQITWRHIPSLSQVWQPQIKSSEMFVICLVSVVTEYCSPEFSFSIWRITCHHIAILRLLQRRIDIQQPPSETRFSCQIFFSCHILEPVTCIRFAWNTRLFSLKAESPLPIENKWAHSTM
jgi:hypothetical protein